MTEATPVPPPFEAHDHAHDHAHDAREPLHTEELTDDLITPDYRVFQRRHGHRFSVDDVATAYVAFETAPHATLALDLGSGLGSVLHMLAWRMQQTQFVAIEAQEVSFSLLRRNVERNGLGARSELIHGDLRTVCGTMLHRTFPLITGTPPYFPEGHALPAKDLQRTLARMEQRGGVDAYIAAGAPLLAPTGAMVLCADARADTRLRAAAELAGLQITAITWAIPKEGKVALFGVWTLRHRPAAEQPQTDTPPDLAHYQGEPPIAGAWPVGVVIAPLAAMPVAPAAAVPAVPAVRSLTLRTADGKVTSDANALRAFSGFGPK